MVFSLDLQARTESLRLSRADVMPSRETWRARVEALLETSILQSADGDRDGDREATTGMEPKLNKSYRRLG